MPIVLINRLRKLRQYHGFWGLFQMVIRGFFARLKHLLVSTIKHENIKTRTKELLSIIENHQGFIDVLHFPVGWNNVMFQRYRHISTQMSSFSGCLALYGGNWRVDKNLFAYCISDSGVFIYDATTPSIQRDVLMTLKASNAQKMIRIQSIDNQTTLSDVYAFMNSGFKVVYEYIDLLKPEVIKELSADMLARHDAILLDERITVVVTSDKLFDDVMLRRNKNCFLSTNGVDPRHWRLPSRIVPPDMMNLVEAGRIILGYHGTLAHWIDYDLLQIAADDGRFEIVLIGLMHDNSFRESGLYGHPNVHYLGGKPYEILNHYASCYDVALLPFKRNDLTDTVSPVKIFEYMAAGKPIVATDLLECKKYKSCIITEKHEFISKLELALDLRNDEDYLSTLGREADENSWRKKTMDILSWVGIEIENFK